MDIKLKVFKKVAEKLSFTKAAKELYITQPAVTKSIKSLEQELEYKLFIRKGNQIELTPAGKILLNHAKIIENQRNILNFELSALDSGNKGEIIIGASTTITQYILPRILAAFHTKFKDLRIKLRNGNTAQIENALKNNEINFGIIEGQSKKMDFRYKEFLDDEIVLVVKNSNTLANIKSLDITEVMNLPLIIREEGSGTREVIEYHLRNNGYILNDFSIELELGSTEAIKNYILNSNAFALLSINSVLKELKRNEFAIIDIDNLEIKRNFNFIFNKNQENKLVDLFMNFIFHYNFW